MELVLHVGAHKTASTTFQIGLRPHAKLFSDHGVAVVSKQYKVNGDEIYRRYRSAYTHDNPKDLRDTLAPFFDTVRSTGVHTALFSDEDLAGLLPGGRSGFYPQARERIEGLIDAAKAHKIRVLLYIRRPDTFLESCYKQFFSIGRPILFEEYLSSLALTEWSWRFVVDQIEAAVGRENLVVRPFEALRALGKQAEFSSTISRLFPDLPPITFAGKDANGSLDANARWALLVARESKSRGELRDMAMDLRPQRLQEREQLLPDLFRAALLEYHFDDTAEVFRRHISDFNPEDLGYRGQVKHKAAA